MSVILTDSGNGDDGNTNQVTFADIFGQTIVSEDTDNGNDDDGDTNNYNADN
ncbi:MAG: hypothetical protein U5M51_01245 [Emticicia sp.]|nr:hypothetical protein [Emticicia sp.]